MEFILQVNRRGGFSDRQGIKEQNSEIQIYALDERTRVKLYNLFGACIKAYVDASSYYDKQFFYRYMYDDVFCQPVDADEEIYDVKFIYDIKDIFLKATYDDVLTLTEVLAEFLNSKYGSHVPCGHGGVFVNIFEKINDLFEKEYVGYRFIGNMISPISDEIEIGSVNEALKSEFAPVNEHIEKSLGLLSDRDKPDYENSIKESISAVEAMCEIITKTHGKDASLGKALNKLEENDIFIHASLKVAFEKLFGYTCDANGLRHAGDIGGPAATFEEAKFMLVACSAFVNYLKGNMSD